MLSFIGDYTCKLDSKGRAVVPVVFRKEMQAAGEVSFVMRRNMLIPRKMLDSIGIEGDEIVMVGQDSKIEIWGKIKYEESTMNTDEFVLLTSQIGL